MTGLRFGRECKRMFQIGGNPGSFRLWRSSNREGMLAGCRSENGQTIVELSLCFSILLSAVFGIIYFCFALYSYNYVSEASREATRWAMVRGSKSCTYNSNLSFCNATAPQITTYVKGLGGVDPSQLTVTPQWCAAVSGAPGTWAACAAGTANTPGNEVQVQVQYNFPLDVPFWRSSFLTVTSTSTMVISQ